jgi:four helix bundle protein
VPIYIHPDGFAEWEAALPVSLKRDPIWRTPAYRYGVWLSDLAKKDLRLLRGDPAYRNTADQLLRAVEGISSNLAEGYSRSTGPERARYYDYALATTRESRDWYFKAREALGIEVVERRLSVLERIIRILTAVVPRERSDRSRARRRRQTGDTDAFGTSESGNGSTSS